MLKNWILNLILAAIAVVILVWLAFTALKIYTRHDVEIAVPNLKGLTIDEVSLKLERVGLNYVISDSIYTKDVKRNGVTEQNPKAGEKVKPNRIIYLTLNSLPKPRVKMPKLTDRSLNLAKAILENNGLELGEITTVYDEIGHNLVISQKYRGAEISANEWIDKGSKIDLVVSTNKRDNKPLESSSLGTEQNSQQEEN